MATILSRSQCVKVQNKQLVYVSTSVIKAKYIVALYWFELKHTSINNQQGMSPDGYC